MERRVSDSDDTSKDLVGRSQLIRSIAGGLVARGLRDLVVRVDDVVIRSSLMWARNLSPEPVLTLEDARRYARDLRLGGYSDWRLPTHDELQRLIDPSEFAKTAGDRRPFPLVEPFNISVDDRVHSDTEIAPSHRGEHFARLYKINRPPMHKGGHYVMRTFNGHTFNGAGSAAYVWAVRDIVA